MAKRKSKLNWYHVDLHLHTPASSDYYDKDISYLDILKKAEARGLDILAFTDHNTVSGYAAMQREIEQLTYLKQLGRATPQEEQELADYHRLLDQILVLPGFEFTATFGFHILGIFSPQKTVREIEHLLLNLHVPINAMEQGSSEVGASSDVLHAYEVIREAGGLVIAAHANANHGVAMRGMDFGGQTRIAYTQDINLHCLEITDLGSKRRNSTQRFFNGTKPEYPRKMRCIQGSDAHALETIIDRRGKVVTLGVGERTTEVLLRDKSFEALLEMFESNDFSRSRAYEGGAEDDYVQDAREEGESIIQSFHESMQRKGGHLYAVVSDVCAFANTNGGTVYIGVDADPSKPVKGVNNANEAIEELQQSIGRMISPELKTEIDTLESNKNTVIRIQVSQGDDRPYAIDEYKIYVRDENETNLAVRDEIVSLVRQGIAPAVQVQAAAVPPAAAETTVEPSPVPVVAAHPFEPDDYDDEDDVYDADDDEMVGVAVADADDYDYDDAEDDEDDDDDRYDDIDDDDADEDDVVEDAAVDESGLNPAVENHALPRQEYVPPVGRSVGATYSNNGIPRAGVEIVGTEQRNGTNYHIMRDLRNGNIVHNVTRESARRLWHYAIRQLETNPVHMDDVDWASEGDIGLWRSYKRGNDVRYDLVKREPNGKLRVFYGVSEAGMNERWQQFLEPDEE